jgi:hypothetical protein
MARIYGTPGDPWNAEAQSPVGQHPGTTFSFSKFCPPVVADGRVLLPTSTAGGVRVPPGYVAWRIAAHQRQSRPEKRGDYHATRDSIAGMLGTRRSLRRGISVPAHVTDNGRKEKPSSFTQEGFSLLLARWTETKGPGEYPWLLSALPTLVVLAAGLRNTVQRLCCFRQ